jgi:hypothetical protein
MSPKIWTTVAFSLALTACQTTGGGCPSLVGYSPAQQRQAAKELRALRKDAQLAKMIADYGKTRAACRIGAK